MLLATLMYIHSVVATWLVHYTLGTGLWGTVIIAGLYLALYWGYTGTILLKPTEEITGGAGFSIGHQQMIGDWLAYKLGPIVGDPKKSIEEYADRVPKSLRILQDKVVSSGIIMFLFVGTIMLLNGAEYDCRNERAARKKLDYAPDPDDAGLSGCPFADHARSQNVCQRNSTIL